MDKKQSKSSVRGPLILAFETATDLSAVALFESGRLLAQQEYRANKLHAKLMTVMAEQLMGNLEIAFADLSAVAVTCGPGSYTGLRVGTSVVKGLAMALGIPLLSFGSLELLAWSVRDFAQVLDARICPMIDARRMEVFAGVYDQEGKELREVRAEIIDDSSFQEELAVGNLIFLGDGAAKCQAVLGHHPNAIFLEDRLSQPQGLGALLEAKRQAGLFEDLVTFEPYYLKSYIATISKKKLL